MRTVRDHDGNLSDSSTPDILSEIKEITHILQYLFIGPDSEKIRHALDIVDDLFADKKRKNGQPGLIHPLKTALRTAEIGLGAPSVCAALLHDALEDYPDDDMISEHIAQRCGEDVLSLVLAIMDASNSPAEMAPDENAPIARKYYLSTIKDLRVLIIKLTDKLHNLETIDGLEPSRQISYAKEIENIYLPISEYLGLGFIHKQMNDNLFRLTHPEEYAFIDTFIKKNLTRLQKRISDIESDLKEVVNLCGCSGKIEGRIKSIPSIHKKVIKYQKEGKSVTLHDIKDIIAFRIITPDDPLHCYEILATVTGLFPVVEGTHNDYIANPKPNGYKSIHVTLLDNSKQPFELQIKTRSMHEHNEYGHASHAAYKESRGRNTKVSKDFSWTASVARAKRIYRRYDDRPIPFDPFPDSIFIRTPKNEFFELPKGSTAIDAAYNIHTGLGNQMVSALVNGRPFSIIKPLHNGDYIEIIKNSQRRFPDESWLNYAKSPRAREKIQVALRQKNRSLQKTTRKRT